MIYSICVHTRDFKYIDEFIQHHLDLGFDRIVIYDNLSKIPVTYNDNRVIIIDWNVPLVRLNTYNDYIKNYCDVDGWTAFIDEDEFINTNGLNIKDVMSEFKDFDSLAINWRLFGDVVDDDNNSTSIRGKYLYHFETDETLSSGNSHIKTISKNDSLRKFDTMPHYPFFKSGKVNKNVRGEEVYGAFSKPDHTKIWIDHYHLRGLDDYLMRKWVGLENNAHLLQTKRTKQNVLDTYYQHRNLATQKLK
jgi:hypothetical protein